MVLRNFFSLASYISSFCSAMSSKDSPTGGDLEDGHSGCRRLSSFSSIISSSAPSSRISSDLTVLLAKSATRIITPPNKSLVEVNQANVSRKGESPEKPDVTITMDADNLLKMFNKELL